PVGHAQYPADIAQDCPRLQFSKGDDLSDAVAPVFPLNVADHLVAPVLAEVDVEIRHRHPLGIEKPLEHQAEPQRIKIADRQRPGATRSGPGPAPGTHWDTLPLRPLDDVGDDQEIPGEPHPDDRVELECKTLAIGGCSVAANFCTDEPLLQPSLRSVAQGSF